MKIAGKSFIVGLVSFIAFFLEVSTGLGAYLESDANNPPRAAAVPPWQSERPGPEPVIPLKTLLAQLKVGRAINYRGLSVYPLLAGRSVSQDIQTLDEALAADLVVISEAATATVSCLNVRNDSDRHVFMMAGEIIAGGKQNRIIREDVLLPPESRFIRVPVYCGEQDRWTHSHGNFSSSGLIASPGIRKMAAAEEPQGAIWNEIDGQMKRAKVSSATRDYQLLYKDENIRSEFDECLKHYSRFCGRRTVGVVVLAGGRIVSCDVFSDARLMSAMWEKICRSFALSAGPAGRRRHNDGRAQVEAFLEDLAAADYKEAATVGAGTMMLISGRVHGNVLNFRGNVVHAAVFPGRKMPPPEPPIVPYPVPQQRYRTEDRLWREEK